MTQLAQPQDTIGRIVDDLKAELEALPSAGRLTQATADAIYALAYNAIARGHYEEALGQLSVLLVYRPTDVVYLSAMARVLQRLRRHDQAIAVYSFLGSIDAMNPSHLLSVAECQVLSHAHDDARDILATVIRFCREYPGHDAVLKRAGALMDLLKPKGAQDGSR